MNYPLIEKYGRRPLLITGMAGMVGTMAVLGVLSLLEMPLFSQIIIIVAF